MILAAWVNEIIQRPYTRCFVQDRLSGSFTVYVLEMPGCISEGGDLDEADFMLGEAAKVWLGDVLRQGLPVPLPLGERAVWKRLGLT